MSPFILTIVISAIGFFGALRGSLRQPGRGLGKRSSWAMLSIFVATVVLLVLIGAISSVYLFPLLAAFATGAGTWVGWLVARQMRTRES
jgi:hypothetical protein